MDNTKQYRIESKTNTGNDSPLKKGTLEQRVPVTPLPPQNLQLVASYKLLKKERDYRYFGINE